MHPAITRGDVFQKNEVAKRAIVKMMTKIFPVTRSLAFLIMAIFFAGSVGATPVFVNFQSMADGGYGESAWQPLSLLADYGIDVEINGFYGTSSAFAYLDAGTAGLGVCRALNSRGTSRLNQKNAGSGSNLCQVSSDDNVKGAGEGLDLLFNEDIGISQIWFNNNHDRDWGLQGDTVVIGGANHTFTGGEDHSDLGWLFEFTGTEGLFSASDHLEIAYYAALANSQLVGEEFYISAIEFETGTNPPSEVPAPASLLLLLTGLAGIRWSRRC